MLYWKLHKKILPTPLLLFSVILHCHYFGRRVFKNNHNLEVHINNNIILSLSSTIGNRKLEESHLNKHKKKNEQRVDLSVFRLGYNVMNGIRAYWKPFYHLLPFLGWLVASIFSLRLFLGVYDSFQSHNVFCDIHSTSYIILFSHILHPKDFPKV